MNSNGYNSEVGSGRMQQDSREDEDNIVESDSDGESVNTDSDAECSDSSEDEHRHSGESSEMTFEDESDDDKQKNVDRIRAISLSKSDLESDVKGARKNKNANNTLRYHDNERAAESDDSVGDDSDEWYGADEGVHSDEQCSSDAREEAPFRLQRSQFLADYAQQREPCFPLRRSSRDFKQACHPDMQYLLTRSRERDACRRGKRRRKD